MKENGKNKKFNLDNASNYFDVTSSMIQNSTQQESQEEKNNVNSVNNENTKSEEIKRGRPHTTRIAEKGSQKGLKEGYTRKTFILRDDLIERLDHFAWYERTTLTEVMNKMIEEYLNENEKEK